MLKNLRQWEGGGVAQRRFPAIGIGLHNQLLLLLAIGNLSIGQDFISMYIGVRGVGSGRDAKKNGDRSEHARAILFSPSGLFLGCL